MDRSINVLIWLKCTPHTTNKDDQVWLARTNIQNWMKQTPLIPVFSLASFLLIYHEQSTNSCEIFFFWLWQKPRIRNPPSVIGLNGTGRLRLRTIERLLNKYPPNWITGLWPAGAICARVFIWGVHCIEILKYYVLRSVFNINLTMKQWRGVNIFVRYPGERAKIVSGSLRMQVIVSR